MKLPERYRRTVYIASVTAILLVHVAFLFATFAVDEASGRPKEFGYKLLKDVGELNPILSSKVLIKPSLRVNHSHQKRAGAEYETDMTLNSVSEQFQNMLRLKGWKAVSSHGGGGYRRFLEYCKDEQTFELTIEKKGGKTIYYYSISWSVDIFGRVTGCNAQT